MQKVFIAIPSHSGDIRVGTFMSVLQSVMDLKAHDIECNVQCWVGDSIIPNARNVLLAKFQQETDCTDLVFVDGDISWRAGELLKLINHPVDFVGGGYRFKNDIENYPMQWMPDPEGKGLWADPATGLIEVAGTPTGFLRLTRAAIDQLTSAYDGLWYRERLCPELKLFWLCDLQIDNHTLRGEDYGLCKKWRDIGGRVWLDPELKLDHTGHKEFHGAIGSWLKNRDNPVDPADAVARLDGLRKSLGSPEIMALLDKVIGEAA